jgi:hypothetical protein
MRETMDRRAEEGYSASWPTEGSSGEKTVTETEWLNCTDPTPMLEFLRRSTPPARRKEDHRRLGHSYLPDSDYYLPDLGRKVGLFVCACLSRSPSKQAVEESLLFREYERYCDGLAPWAAVEEAYWTCIKREQERIAEEDRKNNSVTSVHWMETSEYFADPDLIRQAAEQAVGGKNADGFAGERRLQCGFIRDIFNPFRSVTISPAVLAWNDAAVVRLAQAAYEERQLPAVTLDNERLAILADALEEAGCTDAEFLAHLRGPGPHVRGCWAVDIVLGKS